MFSKNAVVFCLKCLGIFKKRLDVLSRMCLRINIRILLPPVQQYPNYLFYSVITVADVVQHHLFSATKKYAKAKF